MQRKHRINLKNKLHVYFFPFLLLHQLCFRELSFLCDDILLCRLKCGLHIFCSSLRRNKVSYLFFLPFILLSPKAYISSTANFGSLKQALWEHSRPCLLPPLIRQFIYLDLFIATLNLESPTLGIPSWCLVRVITTPSPAYHTFP